MPANFARKENILQRIARIAVGGLLTVMVAQAVPTDAIAQKDAAPPTDQSAERDRMAKFNKAVDTLNFASSWIDGSFSRYADQVDLARGPTGHESPMIMGTSGSLGALKELEQLLGAKPGSDAIDALARRFARTGQGLIPLLDRARLYYDQKDYKDDDYAKAREMHGPLVAAYRDFHNAAEELRAEVRRIGDERRDKEMVALMGDGRILRYSVMLNLKQARQTLEFLRAELREKHDVAKIDSDALKLKNDAMDETLKTIRELKQADPATVTREYRMLGSSNLDQYIWKSEEFLKVTKYVQRAVRDHEPISESEFDFGGGRQGHIIRRFNDVVAEANALN
jgi:uncharacterized protein DUF3829